MKYKGLICLVVFIAVTQLGLGNTPISFEGKRILVGQQIELLVDSSASLTFDEVRLSPDFVRAESDVPNLGISTNAYWARFQVVNNTRNQGLNVVVDYALIDSISMYQLRGDSLIFQNHAGGLMTFESKQITEHQSHIYTLPVAPGDTITGYIRVSSGAQLMLPMYIGSRQQILGMLLIKDLLFGMYMGIILVMVLYNGFIYMSLRDSNYLLYIVYLLSVLLTQASLEGYVFRFILPDNPTLATLNIYMSSALIGITAIVFAIKFLDAKSYTPKLYRVSFFFIAVYLATMGFALVGWYNLSYQIILISAALSGVYVFILAITVLLKGSRSARFFLLAWSIFIAGVIIYVLKDIGLLPYNSFTYSALRIGSSFEAVLLSFALADRINVYRQEKQTYQQKAYEAILENEKIIRDQNALLERQVELRTRELNDSNQGLKKAMKDLKEAEMHLVESEKMASLGQLTAGIAHEINNPINFVAANVTPLKRDVAMLEQLLDDVETIGLMEITYEEKVKKIAELKEEADYDYLKVEIDHLLKGIADGAERTTDIVKGLRVFARLDEDDIKLADMNEGLDSSMAIIRNLLNGKIDVEKEYASLPLIECYPGKLNQVFLNIITNAIHAIHARWGDKNGGRLIIVTSNDENNVYIRITDNGMGMSETTSKKLFEPFYTTKDVGHGTGLGLSISWNTIKQHNGTIEVQSALGEGATFLLTLPIKYTKGIIE